MPSLQHFILLPDFFPPKSATLCDRLLCYWVGPTGLTNPLLLFVKLHHIHTKRFDTTVFNGEHICNENLRNFYI